MSKRITLPWYLGAWAVAVLALVAYIASVRSHDGGNSAAMVLAALVAVGAAIVTSIMWIGALAKLGVQRAWGWFVALLTLHLVGLGIVGMIAYGVAGPPDAIEPLVIRPRPRPMSSHLFLP